MEPVRILQVVTIMNRGGLETMLMNYYRQLDRNRIQFDFLVHREEEGHYDQEIRNLGGKIHKMPQIRPGNYRKYFNQLNAFFSSHKEYMVVHSHINENSSFVLRVAKKAGIPCRIAHSHLSDLGIDIKLPFRLYGRFSMKDYPSHYFACSSNAGKWLFGKKVEQQGGLKVLNNAVNVNDFKFNPEVREQEREKLGLKDELVIGHVGRFNKQKNHEFLIDIFNSVQYLNENTVLLLIGDGDLRDQIEKKVHSLGLGSKVKFLGVRADIPNLMQAMDLFLFPSLFEGLPVVLVEAQAAGLKCIVSDEITKECNVTDSIEFVSLQQTSNYWASRVILSSYKRIDTLERLRENGYDVTTMVRWLTNFYENFYTKEAL